MEIDNATFQDSFGKGKFWKRNVLDSFGKEGSSFKWAVEKF